MNHASAIRIVRASMLGALLLACGHTPPFSDPDYLAKGPRIPGPEARLSAGGVGEAWARDGGGILYIAPCLERPSLNPALTVPAIILLPATGGSAIWDECEAYNSIYFPEDSVETFPAAALGNGGRLVYVETVTRGYRNPPQLDFPEAAVADLWLTDSTAPFTRRRHLLHLYNDTLGAPKVARTDVNWLTDLTWTGSATFVGLGQNLLPDPDSAVANIAVMVGTIGSDSVQLRPIPGTEQARLYSVAQDGTQIVFTRDSLTIAQVPIAGGVANTITVIPSGAGGAIKDLSCKMSMCLVLTQGQGGGSMFWTVSLADGTVTLLATRTPPFDRARISPTSNAVIVGGPSGLFLFTDLLP